MSKPRLEYNGVDLSHIAMMIDLWKSGEIDREIAVKVKVPMGYVTAVRHMLGLDPNRLHVDSPSRKQAVLELARTGMNAEQVARILKINVVSVRRWFEEIEK